MNERSGDWIQTFTGRRFWPLDPRPEEIDIRDVARSLAHLCRWTGHCQRFLSVAQHSVLVASLAPPGRKGLWWLLHDAAEAYLGDVSRPLKRSLRIVVNYYDPPWTFEEVEEQLLRAVAVRFDLPPLDETDRKALRLADDRLLATEVRDLMTSDPECWGKWLDGIVPLPETIHPWSPKIAERAFLNRFGELGGEIGG